jgi:hypothetical protein
MTKTHSIAAFPSLHVFYSIHAHVLLYYTAHWSIPLQVQNNWVSLYKKWSNILFPHSKTEILCSVYMENGADAPSIWRTVPVRAWRQNLQRYKEYKHAWDSSRDVNPLVQRGRQREHWLCQCINSWINSRIFTFGTGTAVRSLFGLCCVPGQTQVLHRVRSLHEK